MWAAIVGQSFPFRLNWNAWKGSDRAEVAAARRPVASADDVARPEPAEEPEASIEVGPLLEMVTAREREAIELLFGLTRGVHTPEEAAGVMGCSPRKVADLVQTGLTAIRRAYGIRRRRGPNLVRA